MAEAGPIHALLLSRIAEAPDAGAVVDGGLRLTNAELLARVDAVARFLVASGVGRGDRVGQLAPPSADFWIVMLAATSIGAIWHGLNPRYQRSEYAYLLSDARPKLVFVRSPFEGRNYHEELNALSAEPIYVRLDETPLAVGDARLSARHGVDDAALNAARAAVGEEAVGVIVHTSGTTGQPKGAMLSQRAIVHTAQANLKWMSAPPACTVCPAPINHVGALNNVCMTTFAGGGRIVFYPRVDLIALAEINKRERPDYLVSSPTAFAMMLANPAWSPEKVDWYKTVAFGGAATPAPVLREIMKTGARFCGVFGQTETCGMMTFTAPDATPEELAESFGRPIEGVDLRIGDADGRTLPDGEIGEIQVKGVCVMDGYFGKPQATAEAFTPDGWLRTGDLGHKRLDGAFSFDGRLKEMFKSGGYNVYPVEVELAIAAHPAVAQVAIVSRPHPLFQEVGHAFLLPQAGERVTGEEVKAFLEDRIADYKIPKTWDVLDAFPFLPNGKIDKRRLAATLPDESRTDVL